MDIQFLGATGTVTGSKYLVAVDGLRVLVDCGLFQGYKTLRLRNWEPLPVSPATLDAVVLTHAHLDHSGYLPLLVRDGFRGKVYCTAATRDLCHLLLPDSGRLLEEEAGYANRHATSKHTPALPLYSEADAVRALRTLVPVDFGHVLKLSHDLSIEFRRAGHILGAAMLRIQHQGQVLTFSGDLGRLHDPLMMPPAPIEETDYLVLESTYGDRCHAADDPIATLGKLIRDTTAHGGVVIIPSFAVGRAQEVLYYIHQLKQRGEIPSVLPVYLNSPMATEATAIFQRHRHDHLLSAKETDAVCHAARIVTTVEESIALNRSRAPKVIIAASGMATGGRVLHHLAAFAPDARNTIVFAGFQAGGTRGAALVGGAPNIKIFGEYVPVRAKVVQMDNLSAHADQQEILTWLGNFKRPPRMTYLTHGEPSAADALRLRIEERYKWPCRVPQYRDREDLR
ncbi:MBL fold metallo-hydrolase [Pseudoduganella eburnea]|uniref:MBL fold metallo-hydrolase n=1 Tax=Massilia eburnea TaxID=1776165 RepID=A0A6L6QBY7_9BURK|nr:MBL fold metallo-hydrolase [Massilia eburnea]MTW10028.1 MBL fold metallo-hydrolase [Massilia eburnea]